MKITKTDALLDLLEIIHKTCIDKAPKHLTYDSKNMQAPYMFALYSIVVELAGDSFQAVKSRKELASHVLTRALLEAVVDLFNVINDPNYVNIRLQMSLTEGQKPLKHLLDNPDLIDPAKHTVKDIQKLLDKGAELRSLKVDKPNINERFKKAGMETYYYTRYAFLCNYCHPSASVIINRPIRIKICPLDEKGTQRLANWIADLVLKASISVHEFLKTGRSNIFKDLAEKWRLMQESKMKDICSCDVKDKELLACFREKLKRWKACLSDTKDYHSIYNQLTRLFWDHAVYRTFNEARRLSIETNDSTTGLQGTIIDLLDRNYMDSQATAIRRLTDVNSTKTDREVYSLRGLTDEIKANIRLCTRENYVCYDGISFDEAPDGDHHVKHLRHSRQMRYDYLSGKDKNSRSRDDKLSPTVFAEMEKKIEEDFKITKEVRIYVNNWVAHAAAPWNRKEHDKVLDKVSLRKLDECYQALIRIGKKVELLIDKHLVCTVPTPQFDQLKNWDKPVVIKKDLDALREYWLVRSAEIETWAKEAIVIHR